MKKKEQLCTIGGFSGGVSSKEPTCNTDRCKRLGFSHWVGKSLWRRAWQSTPVFLPGEFHGQRSFPVALVVKNPSANASDLRDVSLILGSGRFPGGGHGNPLLVFLPGESHGQRSLTGYSP